MKRLLIALMALSIASCCSPDKTRTECVGGWALGTAALVGGAVIAYDRFGRNQTESVNTEAPDWSEDTYWKGALISPTKFIYSRHLWKNNNVRPTINGKTGTIRLNFNGKKYRVVKIENIQDPRTVIGWGESMGTTDIGLMTLERPVTNVEPVKIAEDLKGGDMLTLYLAKSGTKKSACRSAGAYITFGLSRGNQAQPGDSSSPVVNEKGELVSLVTTAGASNGPNLTNIRDNVEFK